MKKSYIHYFGFLFLLFASGIRIELLHGAKKTGKVDQKRVASFSIPPLPKPPVPSQKSPEIPIIGSGLIGMSPSMLLASVRLLIESHSIELLVEQLQGITAQMACDFMQELIKQSHSMDADEVTQVGYGILSYFAHDQKVRATAFEILDLLDSAPELNNKPPLLVIAAHSSYPGIIPLVLAWANERERLQDVIQDALKYIALNFDEPMLKRLEKYGVSITPERATFMLWHIVQTPSVPLVHEEDSDDLDHRNAQSQLVKYLISKKADVNYNQGGYTVLIKATELNDPETLELLLQAGAEVNAIINDQIGSALQLAINKDLIDAELILRRYHARE